MSPRIWVLLLVLTLMANAGRAWERVVYTTNWAQYRKGPGCAWTPKDLPPQLASQALYSFAFLNDDFSVKLLEPNDSDLIKELQALKNANKDLKTLLVVGGWTMNTPGSGYESLFTNMAASAEGRAAFIKSVLAMVDTYGFNGLDLDWEYPADKDRGGRPEDVQNFPTLLQELQDAFKGYSRPLLLSLAVSASPSSWGGYDLAAIHPKVDNLNLMAYDFHGSWETQTGYNAPWVDPQSDAGLEAALNYYINDQKVPAEKLLLGLGFYGHSWTLDSINQAGLGAPAATPGKPGNCTQTPGSLAWREIKAMLDAGAVETVDKDAMQAYAVLGDQWVSYDNVETLGLKVQKAKDWGLKGVMVWSADQDTPDYMLLKAIQG